MVRHWTHRVRRGLRKPPRVIVQLLGDHLRAHTERFRAPRRAAAFADGSALLRALRLPSIDRAWDELSRRPYPAFTTPISTAECDLACPGESARVLSAADAALARRVEMLGTGPLDLGDRIDWHRDYKTGFVWPPAYARSIDCANLDRPSDVKVPWEISRLQWLMPAGQAFLLTGDERYARRVRETLEDWISANPYAGSVNWSCTLEPAMRTIVMTWFFHIFKNAEAWRDPAFRVRFLTTLFLHGDYTNRHLELDEINGNHCTADAVALVCAGLFFGRGRSARKWADRGWKLLCVELPRQVTPDGVDFEASVAYHRFVAELFFMAARYREVSGLDVPRWYRARIEAMAAFAAACTGPDGRVPLWGDADDARVLPFGPQGVNDHRYLGGVIGAAWNVEPLRNAFSGPRAEILWHLGPDAAAAVPRSGLAADEPQSELFPDGGFCIMQNRRDHIFVDCGPVGQGGRGGHGHNDCLSFEAVLDGVRLISDRGAYLYTASPDDRNAFRSTASHNTPCINGQEVNRFIGPHHLWQLRNDALPSVRRWSTTPDCDVLCASHSGYERLAVPVTPVRTIVLDHAHHMVLIRDAFEGLGSHTIEIPIHLAPGVAVSVNRHREVELAVGGRRFSLLWAERDWSLLVNECSVSPSYGVTVPSVRLSWKRHGRLEIPLTVAIMPVECRPIIGNPVFWFGALVNGRAPFTSSRDMAVAV
jgi:uncharacterized heparinase superfamily protein